MTLKQQDIAQTIEGQLIGETKQEIIRKVTFIFGSTVTQRDIRIALNSITF